MPREITERCYHCDGRGFNLSGEYSSTATPRSIECQPCEGKGYVVTEITYTKEELQEAISRTTKECALICEGLEGGFVDRRFAEAIRSKE